MSAKPMDSEQRLLEDLIAKAHWVNCDPKKLKIFIRFNSYQDYQDAMQAITKAREGTIYAHQAQT